MLLPINLMYCSIRSRMLYLLFFLGKDWFMVNRLRRFYKSMLTGLKTFGGGASPSSKPQSYSYLGEWRTQIASHTPHLSKINSERFFSLYFHNETFSFSFPFLFLTEWYVFFSLFKTFPFEIFSFFLTSLIETFFYINIFLRTLAEHKYFIQKYKINSKCGMRPKKKMGD